MSMANDPSGQPGAQQPAPYAPFIPAEQSPPELTIRALVAGVLLGIIFGASSLYLVLKVGLTVSASIPVAVLSITLFRVLTPLLGRRNSILENNIVQTAGSAGESIAFGVGVTMPALMILGYDMELLRVTLVAVLGGLLGVLMMIPLRRAFIVKQHGKLAYPEGTACAEVLIVGEKGGTSALTVFVGFALAAVYQFLMVAMHLWKETSEWVIDKAGAVFHKGSVSADVNPALLGVGYIIGPKIAATMLAGGILSYWVLIPAIAFFGAGLEQPLFPETEKSISGMGLGALRNSYVLYIGAGAVATGGLIAMLRALPIIAASFGRGVRDLSSRAALLPGGTPRTDRDLPLKVVLFGSLGIVLAICIAPMLEMNILGAVMIVLFGFLFVTVSSRLTGEIGSSSNPISGMTVATLLMTCLVFLALGWTGKDHRLTALSVAAIVCIAASNGGTTSQDLKTGFLVGGTPWRQQIAILIGALTSALVIGVILLMLNDAGTIYSKKDLPEVRIDVTKLEQRAQVGGKYAATDQVSYFVLNVGQGETPPLVTDATEAGDAPPSTGASVAAVRPGKYLVDADGHIAYLVDPAINGRLAVDDAGKKVTRYDAPKAALMSLIIDGILTQQLPWTLVLLGVAIALLLELCGVPSLPFAVGVYLPLSSSTPIFIGGALRWIADRRRAGSAAEGDMSPGVLLSSGYIAGGATVGIVTTLILANDDYAKFWNMLPRIESANVVAFLESNGWALVPFLLLAGFLLLVGLQKILRPRMPVSL